MKKGDIVKFTKLEQDYLENLHRDREAAEYAFKIAGQWALQAKDMFWETIHKLRPGLKHNLRWSKETKEIEILMENILDK